MRTLNFPNHNKRTILALGAESAGNFSIYKNGKIYFSADFGDLLEENNFIAFKKAVLVFLKKEKITPDIILTDLHPLMKTTLWGEELAQKYSAKGGSASGGKAEHIQVQHHHAHIFSAIGDYLSPSSVPRGGLGRGSGNLPNTLFTIAMDGTGYGEDEKIWGGEIFKVTSKPSPLVLRGRCPVLRTEGVRVERIGHLENQTMIGGELAIREPARILIAILSKFLSKKEVFNFVKKYYSKNEFELLHSQLGQNFNCLETSSTGRILDAISLLLGFCGNVRKYKHEPIDLLEKNSTEPYIFKPIIENNILQTTPLFAYLIKNIHQNKKRLAATAQLYIAKGLHEIIQSYCHPERSLYSDAVEGSANEHYQQCHKADSSTSLRSAQNDSIFFSGGLASNKIISVYLESQGAYASKIVPRGDNGLSFGQIVYYLLKK